MFAFVVIILAVLFVVAIKYRDLEKQEDRPYRTWRKRLTKKRVFVLSVSLSIFFLVSVWGIYQYIENRTYEQHLSKNLSHDFYRFTKVTLEIEQALNDIPDNQSVTEQQLDQLVGLYEDLQRYGESIMEVAQIKQPDLYLFSSINKPTESLASLVFYMKQADEADAAYLSSNAGEDTVKILKEFNAVWLEEMRESTNGMTLEENRIHIEGRNRVENDLYHHDYWVNMVSSWDRSLSDERLVIYTKTLEYMERDQQE